MAAVASTYDATHSIDSMLVTHILAAVALRVFCTCHNRSDLLFYAWLASCYR